MPDLFIYRTVFFMFRFFICLIISNVDIPWSLASYYIFLIFWQFYICFLKCLLTLTHANFFLKLVVWDSQNVVKPSLSLCLSETFARNDKGMSAKGPLFMRSLFITCIGYNLTTNSSEKRLMIMKLRLFLFFS